MKKRVISVLCGVLMALGLSPTASMTNGATALVDENFNNYTTWSEVYAPDNVSSAGTGQFSVENISKNNKAAFYNCTGPSSDVSWSWGQPSGNYLVISTSFMESVCRGETRLQQVWFADTTNNERAYILRLANKGSDIAGDITIQYADGATMGLCRYYKDTWYQVSTVLDLQNNKIYAYVNGQLLTPNGLDFYNTYTTYVSKLQVQMASDSGNKMYLDNVYVDSFHSYDAAAAAIIAHNLKYDVADSKLSAADKQAFATKTDSCLESLRGAASAEALKNLQTAIDETVPEANNVIYSADFWQLSAGDAVDAKKGSGYYTAASCLTMETMDGETVCKLSNSGSRARLLRTHSATVQEDLVVDFSFLQTEKSAIDSIARTTDGSGYWAYQLSSDGTNIKFNDTVVVADYATNTWYDFTMKLNWREQKVACYVGDSLKAVESFQGYNGEPPKNLSRVFDSYSDKGGTYYIKDVTAATTLFGGNECTVSNTLFTDGEGNTVTKPVAGGTVKSMVLENGGTEDVMVYTAIYGDGVLEAVKSSEVPAGTKPTITLDLAIPTDVTEVAVKQFAWTSGGLKPVTANTLRTPTAENATVYIFGDSTVANVGTTQDSKYTGWGAKLGDYFEGTVTVNNSYSRNGMTLKEGYRDTSYYDAVMAALQPGDYLLIQSAHNDSKLNEITSVNYSDVVSDYRAYLKMFVQSAQAKGALPILVTSPTRLASDDTTANADTLRDYAAAMKSVGRVLNVPVIDLLTETVNYDGNLYDLYYDTTADRTHFSDTGANVLAGFVAEGIKATGYELATQLKAEN